MNKNLKSNSKRDLRIDFFRGCALLIILIDHVEEMNGVHFLQSWTFRAIGFSDMAEAFVFLSGYAFGMSFTRRMERDGFRSCFRRASFRSSQIYGAYLTTLGFTLLLGYILQSTTPQLANFLHLQLPLLDQLTAGLLLSNHPSGFAILGFYALMLPLATVQVWLLRRHAYVVWAISLQLYLVSQCFPEINIKSVIPQNETWYMNQLAWQFLYFVGLAFGSRCVCLPSQRATKWIAASVATGILVIGFTIMRSSVLPIFSVVQETANALRGWRELTDKRTLGPLRLFHFAGVAYLTMSLSIRFPRFAGQPFASPFVLVGQHPLLMYCTGLFLSFASVPICQTFVTGVSSMMLVHFDLVIASIAIAACAHSFSARSRTESPSPSSVEPK